MIVFNSKPTFIFNAKDSEQLFNEFSNNNNVYIITINYLATNLAQILVPSVTTIKEEKWLPKVAYTVTTSKT